MVNAITIEVEQQNRGAWIHVCIPYASAKKNKALLQNEAGEILKSVQLVEGNNAIDISGIRGPMVILKIETAFETVLKNLKINT